MSHPLLESVLSPERVLWALDAAIADNDRDAENGGPMVVMSDRIWEQLMGEPSPFRVAMGYPPPVYGTEYGLEGSPPAAIPPAIADRLEAALARCQHIFHPEGLSFAIPCAFEADHPHHVGPLASHPYQPLVQP